MVTLATMAMPFAVASLLRPQPLVRRLLLMLATALLLAGAMATLRRTAGLMPIAALGALFLLRPREMVRLLPFGVVLVIMLQAVTPGALGSISNMLTGQSLSTQQSVVGRTEDYDAVGPDIWDKPLFGRGYGSYQPREYRFIDNQYLGLAISTGFAGLLAFLGVLLALAATCIPEIRRRTLESAAPMMAAVAATSGFLVASFTFDVLAFPQAPYLLFLIAALALVAKSDKTGILPVKPFSVTRS